ncbi:MAG: electron transfer flavoprotein subunit alpha/FixB family protein [Deltaproteobacteria bacterium]|nr:electron transfer flavoprotein subunit alpha/FixB family protein [Deltaproteobacteria bacterium]
MGGEVWVFVESVEGAIRKVSLELLCAADGFSKEIGGPVGAVLLGRPTDSALENLRFYADRVYLAEDERLAAYTSDGYTLALASLVRKHGPAVLLAGSTSTGRDLFPRVAVRLKTGLIPDCTGLAIGDEGRLLATRPIYGGKVFCQVSIPEASPQMATVRPNTFTLEKMNKRAEVIRDTTGLEGGEIRQKVEGVEKTTQEKVDVAEAEVVVGVGRGIRDPGNFKAVQDLADALGATIGVTRAVVDNGWWDVNDQIGKSGKNISARLYFAFGLSGAIHHVLGIQTCKTVVAVNTDTNALIFNYADYALVGDMMEVIPALKEEITKMKDEV